MTTATPQQQFRIIEYDLVTEAGFTLSTIRSLPAETVEQFAIIHDERRRMQPQEDD